MSKNHEYLRYTEYYIISGAYHIVNIVNEILTHSASYSVNIKEYLRNQVVSKQVALNELVHNENHKKKINNLNDDDVDEDGFVVIKMRRPKKNKNELNYIINNTDIHSDVIKQVVENMIKDVIKKSCTNTNI